MHFLGIYAHSAVYYEPKDTIFVYGGLAFYKEKVQPSDRLYSFHLSTRTWNFHESSTSIKVSHLIIPKLSFRTWLAEIQQSDPL